MARFYLLTHSLTPSLTCSPTYSLTDLPTYLLKAVDGLSRLTGRATQAALSARCFLGGLQHRLASEISEFRDAAATERSLPTPGQSGDACAEAEDCAAQASHAASLAAAPPADMSSFFREMFKS